MEENKRDDYICIFSKKLYIYLKKKNVFPFAIEPNKKYPEFNVFKYHYDEYINKIIKEYREGTLEI